MALLTSLRAGNLLILAGVEGARRRSAAYSLASTRFGDGACAPATRERSICSAPLILRCRCGEIIWGERSARLRKALPRQNSNWARTIRRCSRRSAGGLPGPAHSQRGEQPRAAGAASGVHLAARHRRAVKITMVIYSCAWPLDQPGRDDVRGAAVFDIARGAFLRRNLAAPSMFCLFR